MDAELNQSTNMKHLTHFIPNVKVKLNTLQEVSILKIIMFYDVLLGIFLLTPLLLQN